MPHPPAEHVRRVEVVTAGDVQEGGRSRCPVQVLVPAPEREVDLVAIFESYAAALVGQIAAPAARRASRARERVKR